VYRYLSGLAYLASLEWTSSTVSREYLMSPGYLMYGNEILKPNLEHHTTGYALSGTDILEAYH
jgi:hypothetical protein